MMAQGNKKPATTVEETAEEALEAQASAAVATALSDQPQLPALTINTHRKKKKHALQDLAFSPSRHAHQAEYKNSCKT